MSLRRKILYGFTLTVLAVLLLLPATSWLARMQLLPFMLPPASHLLYSTDDSWQELYDYNSSEAIVKSKNDFTLQYAYALSDSSESLRRLEKLNVAFPQKPMVIAAILRAMSSEALKGWREEENLLRSPEHRTNKPSTKGEPSNPIQLAKFIDLAEAGEKLDTRNAYFSVMVARGYFAAKQDDKAIAAWIRAGEKTEWNDYSTEEISATWKMQCAVNGNREIGTSARITSMALMSSNLFPQFATVDTAARMATVMALQAELQGDREKGFAIRRAGRQIGQNMQGNGKTVMVNLRGGTFISVAFSRPGGEEYKNNPYKGEEPKDRWEKERQAHYTEYLRSIDHPEEATAFNAAIADNRSLKALFTQIHPKTYSGLEGKMDQLFAGWIASFLLIISVLFSLTYAGIFKLVYKFSPRLQKGEPLQKSARWGVATGLLLPVIAGLGMLLAVLLGRKPDQSGPFAFVSVTIFLLVPPLLLRLSWREVGHGLLVLLATVGSIAALIGTGMACAPFLQAVSTTLGMIIVTEGEGAEKLRTIAPRGLGAIVVSVPLGLLALFGIFSMILRVPFAAGVTRGMRAMAVPMACVLTLLWSGAFLFTYHHERAAIQEMEQMVAIGERQYLQQISTDVSAK